MSMSSHLVNRAIALWKRGQKAEARKVLEVSIYNDRHNENAWIWYIYTLETDRDKKAALENFLSIFPNHALGRKALANLNVDKPQFSVTSNPQPSLVAVAPNTHPLSVKTKHSPYSPSIAIPWIIMVLGVCVLLAGILAANSRYNSLQSRYEILHVSNVTTSQDLARVRQEKQSLEIENSALVNQYNALAKKHNSLLAEHANLQINYNSLQAEYTQTLDQYNILADDYNTLNNVAIKPPYIVVHDRKVETTFYDIDGQLIEWTTPFAGLEHDIENGVYMRRLIVDDELQTVQVSRKDGVQLWIRDFSVFITPDTFEKVIPELYAKSSSPYDFIHGLWYMIGQLSNYASEDTETPRYSLETLLAGGGDCEDLSILLASMIKAAPVDWYVDLVYIDSANVNNPREPDHVVVYVDTGKESFILEATNDQIMMPYTSGITGWLAGNLHDHDEILPVYLH